MGNLILKHKKVIKIEATITPSIHRMRIFSWSNCASNNYSLVDLGHWGKMKKKLYRKDWKKETNARGVINKNAKCR